MTYRAPLSEPELGRLPSEQLIAYIGDMRTLGLREAASVGLAILVYGHWVNVVRRVGVRIPAPDVEDVTGEIITSAISSAFDGSSVGEFHVWLGTIAKRRIADYYRKRERRLDADSLDEAVAAGREPAGADDVDQVGYLEVQELIEQVLATRSPEHRAVIEGVVFQDRPAVEVAAEIPGMTAENAYQIVRRFRVDLRALLAARDTPPDPS